jgi:hypothetical protein
MDISSLAAQIIVAIVVLIIGCWLLTDEDSPKGVG